LEKGLLLIRRYRQTDSGGIIRYSASGQELCQE